MLTLYKLKEKKYDLEYKSNFINIFSEKEITTDYCNKYYDDLKLTSSDSMLTPTDFPSERHKCYKTTYFTTLKFDLKDVPFELEHTPSHFSLSEVKKLEYNLRSNGRHSNSDYSDSINDLGHIVKTTQTTCQDSAYILNSKINTIQKGNFVILGLILVSLIIISALKLKKKNNHHSQ